MTLHNEYFQVQHTREISKFLCIKNMFLFRIEKNGKRKKKVIKFFSMPSCALNRMEFVTWDMKFVLCKISGREYLRVNKVYGLRLELVGAVKIGENKDVCRIIYG